MSIVQITQQQKEILKSLQQLQKDYQYQPVSEIQLQSNLSNKSFKPSSAQIDISEPLYWFQPSQEQIDPSHVQLQNNLLQYKCKSNLVNTVGLLIHQYDINFKHLLKQRAELIQTIENIHKDTSDLIYKQKNYIDLANSVKEALDYYSLLDKFQFNWVCQPSAREVFEDILQPTLSELTDAIQFFTVNHNYTNAKKYLVGLVGARTKVTSFTKSFLIKLLNKQFGYSIKNTKTQFHKQIDGFYPKSKSKFLIQFLACFPQFQRQLKLVLLSARDSSISSQAQSNAMLRRQAEVEEFILNESTFSLISYLQKHIPEIYEEVILKFISYYRTSFHENLCKNLDQSQINSQKFQDRFREVYIQSIYILTCQAGYLWYCFKPSTQIAKQYARGALTKIAEFYSSFLTKLAKQPGKNKDPFSICNQVTYILDESDKFLRNYTSRQYQAYALGAIIQYVQQFGVDFLRAIFQKIGTKIKHQLESVCQNMLPKFKQTSDKAKLTQDIKQFVKMIPNLKYCSSQAQKYLISSLDALVKSIKQVSNHIQSRIQCYAWNIQMFGLIEESLTRIQYNLIKKQTKLDVGETTRILERVKSVNRNQNILKYATDLFTVIKTGVPTLSQLTLDFNTFIKEYFSQLKQKFVKDMVFIHAKNIIEFLQSLKQSKKEQALKLCQTAVLKNLQSSYKLSIQNFMNQATYIIELRQKQFAIFEAGKQILLNLLKQVQQTLLDLMGTFYIQVSKYSSQTENFESIGEIRSKFSSSLQLRREKIENNSKR